MQCVCAYVRALQEGFPPRQAHPLPNRAKHIRAAAIRTHSKNNKHTRSDPRPPRCPRFVGGSRMFRVCLARTHNYTTPKNPTKRNRDSRTPSNKHVSARLLNLLSISPSSSLWNTKGKKGRTTIWSCLSLHYRSAII